MPNRLLEQRWNFARNEISTAGAAAVLLILVTVAAYFTIAVAMLG